MTGDDMASLQLLLPVDCADRDDTLAVFLLACCTRAYKDADFIEDMIARLEEWAEEPKASAH